MSNIQLWLKTLDDIVAIVDSTRHSIPMDDLFKDEEMYTPMRSVISHFDLAAWLMFDTEENRPTTSQLVGQLWRHIHKMRGVEPYLERIFDSYLSLYRVNYKSEAGIYVQSILFPEPAVIIEATEGAKELKEGDIFLGRVVDSSVGHFLFNKANVVPENLRKDFSEQVEELKKRQPMIRENTKVYQETLKNGNPEILFLFALAYVQAQEREVPYPFDEDDELLDVDDGILALAQEFSEDEDAVIADMYLLEHMDSAALMAEGVNLEDNRFIHYDELMIAASNDGDFTDDAQLLRIYELLRKWCVEQKNDAGRKSLEPADKKILDYKRRLARSVRGMYRINSLTEARGEMNRSSNWIDQFDRYLETVLDQDLVVTKSGAINQKSLDLVRKNVPIFLQTSKANRESSFPELVFFRKFALLKSMIFEEDGLLLPTIRLEHYMQMDDEDKVVLWVSTILNEKFRDTDTYFRQWPIQGVFAESLKPGAVAGLLIEAPEDKEAMIRLRILQLGRDLDLYDMAVDPGGDVFFIPTDFGAAAFSYMGILEKDNVIAPFE